MTKKSVAVVGAGLAGASAARILLAAGYAVSVFDKSRGVGGRMATRRRDGDAFDHGAQYFTARSDAFSAQVEDWTTRGLAAPWGGRIVGLGAGVVTELETSSGRPGNGDVTRYVGYPKMSVLARDLLGSADLQTGVRIETLARSERGWALGAEDGTAAGVFDRVLLASPAAQTEVLLRSGIATPEAAALADRIAAVEVDPCHAVMVRFASPLCAGLEAQGQSAFDGAFVDDTALAWMARGGSKPGRPGSANPATEGDPPAGAPAGESWLLHSAPDWSRAHVEEASERVATLQLEALARSLGVGGPDALPEVVSVATHRWLYSRTRTPLGLDAIWEPSLGLGLCGDWLRGARVEDAFLSGEAAAKALIASDPR